VTYIRQLYKLILALIICLSDNLFAESAGEDTVLAAYLYNTGCIHLKNNEADPAIENFLKSIMISERTENLSLLKDNYYSIARAYVLKNDFVHAYKYSSMYNIIADKIYSIENSRKIARINSDYESEKKEYSELKLKTKIWSSELKRSRIILYISIFIIVGISVLVLFLLKYLRNLKKTTNMLVDQNFIISQKNDIITDNLNYAKMIQAALLPSHKDFKVLFPDSFILFMPKDIIGGDFVWYKSIDDTKVFALIDCTGHGVSAGLMSVIGNTLLNKIIVEEHTLEPADILHKLDRYYKSLLVKETDKAYIMDGMDIALCTVNSNKLVFSGSYMPVCFISDGKLEVFKGARYLIGGNISNNKSNFINESIKLKKGDYLYMLTDGYYDQFGGQSFRPLRFKNFEKLLLSKHRMPMDKQLGFFHKYIVDWIGDYEQLDDITLVGIKF
jgi:serine phosphatase RsbU (regulator of sigma subunit)